jgi:RNA polymerase sigma-70 factor (ECF subfamily)
MSVPDPSLLLSQIKRDYGSLIRASVSKLVPPQECDDIEAVIYFSIWNAIPRFEGRSSLKNFVYPIVKRRIADFYRHRENERRLIQSLKEAARADAGKRLPHSEAAKALNLLTPAELMVVARMAMGESNLEMGKALGVTPHTIRTHLKSIYKKMKIGSRYKLFLFSRRFFKEDDYD